MSKRSRPRRYPSPWACQIGAITALGVLVRIGLLGREPLWRDEVFTGLLTQQPLGGMLDALRHDSSPPLLYLLTRAVVVVAPHSATGLRIVPALAGAGAIPVAAALARRCGGDPAGRWAAAVAAVATIMVEPARDARMYALATTLVMLGALTLWRALDDPTPARLAVYALVVGAAANTHYLTVAALITQGAAALLVLRPSFRAGLRTGLAGMAGTAALAPWLIVAHGQSSHAADGFWTQPASAKHALGMLGEFFVGDGWAQASAADGVLHAAQLAGACGLIVAGLGAVRWWGLAAAASRRGAAFLLDGFLLGLLALLLLSVQTSLLERRYASVFWGPVVAILGCGLSAVPWRAVRAAALSGAATCTVALAVVEHHGEVPATVSLIPSAATHDLLDAEPGEYLLLLWYADPAVQERSHIVTGHVAWWWGTAAFPPGAVVGSVPPDVVANRGRIWVLHQDPFPAPELPPGYRLVERITAGPVSREEYAPR